MRIRGVSFSPNGRWLAYVLQTSQVKIEIYVRPYPTALDGEVACRSHLGAGKKPVWGPEAGRELFYRGMGSQDDGRARYQTEQDVVRSRQSRDYCSRVSSSSIMLQVAEGTRTTTFLPTGSTSCSWRAWHPRAVHCSTIVLNWHAGAARTCAGELMPLQPGRSPSAPQLRHRQDRRSAGWRRDS